MRLACASDGHWLIEKVKDFPEADVFIYAGDWSGVGNGNESYKFAYWVKGLPYRYKLVVPGNHERWVETYPAWMEDMLQESGAELLIDKESVIDGVKFYGTPWTPEFGRWAFMRKYRQMTELLKNVPADTDVLITHGQPYEVCDPGKFGSRAIKDLLNRIQPKVHIFGHAHEGYGYEKYNNTHCYNVSLCSPSTPEYDNTYKLIHPITVIDI